MVAIFVLLVVAFGDILISNNVILYSGYADIKYDGELVREFNSEFAKLRSWRAVFAIISFVAAIFYELMKSDIFVFLVLLPIVLWFVFSVRDSMRARCVVEEFKVKRGW